MISVIIPVYNAEKSIEKSLNSIKNQTWKGDFEIIIVNDGSTDASVNIINNYNQNHPEQNIIVLHQENGGVSKARNTALKIAKGEYIALLDSDDEWLPEKTEKQMSYIENKNLNIDFLATRRTSHQIKYPYKVISNLAEITFRKLMFRNEAQPSTVIFKRKILQNTGFFNDNQRYSEDLNYWLRISFHNTMFILDEELLYAGAGKRSFGVSGLSGNLLEMEKGFHRNLREMYELKKINSIEFILYYLFYKLKYLFRISRNQFLKSLGK